MMGRADKGGSGWKRLCVPKKKVGDLGGEVIWRLGNKAVISSMI